VGPQEVRAALGGSDPVSLLRGVVLRAIPTVAELDRALPDLDSQTRADLLAVADRAVAHRYDLLGSGLVALGHEIDWQCDFKSRRSWPLDHISQIVISYPDASDIKIPWELSRCQHLPGLAAAYRITNDQRWLDEIGAQLSDWIAQNPVEFGANWACTMDVAIRATNWIATLALVADDAVGRTWFEPVLGSLLLHGRFIRRNLEWAPVRGNHYLADIVGLLAVASLFSDGQEGQAWARFATKELVGELRHHVRADGCDHEASIPYHRLVTELFICGTQAADALAPELLPHDHGQRIDAMLQFVADYTRPDGLAPQVGDADDGRLLPLLDYGRADPRNHLHVFAQAGRRYVAAERPAAYPRGGYWIMRCGSLYVLVRCGDVGVGGLGSHAHNDALSFELALGEQPLVVDPGSYLYTADPSERNRFRSTRFHSTLSIDGEEQNPISETALFAMEDRRRAEMLAWEADGARAVFVGRHSGYQVLLQPAVHARRLQLDAGSGTLRITDTVESEGPHELEWTFPLATCRAEASGPAVVAHFDDHVALEIQAPGVEFRVDEGWVSPSYGVRERVPFVRGTKRSTAGTDVTELSLRAGVT
jgi:hypothetical protein